MELSHSCTKYGLKSDFGYFWALQRPELSKLGNFTHFSSLWCIGSTKRTRHALRARGTLSIGFDIIVCICLTTCFLFLRCVCYAEGFTHFSSLCCIGTTKGNEGQRFCLRSIVGHTCYQIYFGNGHANKRTGRQTNRQIDKDKQRDSPIDTPTNRRTIRHIHGHTDRQANKQTNK